MCSLKILVTTVCIMTAQACLCPKTTVNINGNGCEYATAASRRCDDDYTQKQNVYVINNGSGSSSTAPKCIPLNGASQNSCKYGLTYAQSYPKCDFNRNSGCFGSTHNNVPGFETKQTSYIKNSGPGNTPSCYLNYGTPHCCPYYGTTQNCYPSYGRADESGSVYQPVYKCEPVDDDDAPVSVTVHEDGVVAISV